MDFYPNLVIVVNKKRRASVRLRTLLRLTPCIVSKCLTINLFCVAVDAGRRLTALRFSPAGRRPKSKPAASAAGDWSGDAGKRTSRGYQPSHVDGYVVHGPQRASK